MQEMNKRSIVFGDKQIQSFVTFFSNYWNTYNDELKVFLKQTVDVLVTFNTQIFIDDPLNSNNNVGKSAFRY